MNNELGQELVAYSVEDLGGLWRWRVYEADGQMARQGAEATEEAAGCAALALLFGLAVRQAA
jgi:hypothetical protein